MNRITLAFAICSLLVISGSAQHPMNKAATISYAADTQQHLDECNQRLNEFKQELLSKGFREVSSSKSDSEDQAMLKGDYGALKDLEVTLWTFKQADSEKSRIIARIKAYVEGEEASREFNRLRKKIDSLPTGMKISELFYDSDEIRRHLG